MGIVTAGKDLKAVRESARIVRKVLSELALFIEPGVTTAEIDALGRRIIEGEGAVPSFLDYNGYPSAVCVSINREVVHGIPSAARKVTEGDIVGIDVGAFKNGYHGDAADTVMVGEVSPEARKLVEITYEARDLGIKAAVAGNCVGDIGHAVQTHVEANGYSVVHQLVGHGIGRKLHESPQVPNYGTRGKGSKLRNGLLLAIEPMVNQGVAEVRFLPDGWTVVTADGKLSAHAEHTIMVNGNEPEILTA
ncbi:MAG TPA: type I methionyl aminopeptidase [Candidatus Sabulitectum sp.]|nr:type I methionyl aminopeptidase [Candidatus Sabulitectum sp.]HPF31502.1 type I methionyl aminopeptidase [Candidatus Sabulitectum sp.]HPJ27965.1 type I methionyl aminopeptidase [Candidatus Sabulitectum sp.]HPR21768.1 type I methionyl aminopeptidase [Candidatus Sabulitectum sp.]